MSWLKSWIFIGIGILLPGLALATQCSYGHCHREPDASLVVDDDSYAHIWSEEGPARPHHVSNYRVFIFDPKSLIWSAYNEYGELVRSGRASGGKHYCADVGRSCLTPPGKFRVYRKGNEDCVSSKFPLGQGGAPMPYCMYFHGGYAIHGSPDVPNHNASHGCIRVSPNDAQWLHTNFMRIGTTVIVEPYD